jgi:hypothetical protein
MTMERYLYLIAHGGERTRLENIGRAWGVWRSGGSHWAEFILYAIWPGAWARRYGN